VAADSTAKVGSTVEAEEADSMVVVDSTVAVEAEVFMEVVEGFTVANR